MKLQPSVLCLSASEVLMDGVWFGLLVLFKLLRTHRARQALYHCDMFQDPHSHLHAAVISENKSAFINTLCTTDV